MRNLIKHLISTPQSAPLPGEAQTMNHAGGFVFEVDVWKRLERFLILGADGGTYYVSERQLTLESAEVVLDAMAEDAERCVETIRAVSVAGRAPSNRAALFALALAFCEPKAVPAARAAFTDVVRTGTHLFEFLTAVRGLRGFGRALRGAVTDWYVSKTVDGLAYQLVKYRQRSGWTHRDALRLAHPKDEERSALFGWAAGSIGSDAEGLPSIVRGFAAAQLATETKGLPALIREHRLTHEMVPSFALKDGEVLKALAESMPLGALIRFLGRLAAAGVLVRGSRTLNEIVARIKNVKEIRRARLHPMAILVAQRTYAAGKGDRGSLSWPVSKSVVSALNVAFHKAFRCVEPSGKRVLTAVDVSGSMGMFRCAGASSLTCMEGALAMALVTAGTEKESMLKAFSHQFMDLPVSPEDSINEAMAKLAGMPFGATDCALPMQWALKERRPVDAFVILTDNETWYGAEHPKVALRRYREAMGIPARLVVVAMTGTSFSIADPGDPLSMDVVGFDTHAPALISDFIAGRL
ncbi:MAG: TROVE domain-containing protein [Planctomycetota bacterium]